MFYLLLLLIDEEIIKWINYFIINNKNINKDEKLIIIKRDECKYLVIFYILFIINIYYV